MGLRERMLEVLTDHEWKAADWAREAKLSERTQVHTMLRRLKENPGVTFELKTLGPLAEAANVTLDWLVTGSLPKHRVAFKADERYPSRGEAISAAEFIGLPRSAIAAVSAVNDLSSDPGVEHWLQRIALASSEARRAGKGGSKEREPK